LKDKKTEITNKIFYEKYLVNKSETELRGEPVSEQSSEYPFAELYDTIAYILNSMDIKMVESEMPNNADELVEMMFNPAGVMYEKVDISKGAWKKCNQEILAITEEGYPVIITNSLFGKRCKRISTGYYCRMSSGIKLQQYAYLIYKPIVTEKFGMTTVFKYFLRTIKPTKIAAIVLLTLAISILGLFSPNITKQVLGSYANGASMAVQGLISLAITFGITGILLAFCALLKSLASRNVRQQAGRIMETAIMARVLEMPVEFFREESSSRISSFVLNARKLGELAIDMLFGTSLTALFSLVCIPQMVSFAPSLVVPAIIILALELGFSIFASVVQAENLKVGMETDIMLRGMAFTTIKGIQKIKESGAWKRAYLKWADFYRQRLIVNHSPALIVRLKPLFGMWFSAIGTVIFLIFAGITGVEGAEYMAFISSYSLVAAAITQLTILIDSAYSLKPAVDQLSPLFKKKNGAAHSKYLRKIDGKIRFENVSFSYDTESAFGIKNFSLEIKAGEKIGLVGPSGCGKSTLINMIMGLNKPDSGIIYIDDNNIEKLNHHILNRRIGFVAQFSKLLPGTIRFNVTLGDETISDEDIWEALDKADIGEYVRSLTTGLDTQISENNAGSFSGGQKQCLLLARVFAKKPRLVILDEATSALDERTQNKVLEEIYDLNCTLVMVAHRLSTIEKCDRIFMFEKGAVVEEGTYDELIHAGGKFEMFSKLSGI